MQKTTKEVNKKESKTLNSKSTSTSKKASSKAVSAKAKPSTKSTSKVASKKAPAQKSKTTVSKKTPSKKAVSKTKNTVSNKKSVSKVKKTVPSTNILEYYDLPYRYNETIVKILAQTPKTLFVYWDISDNDRENYIKQYGQNFFEKTKPVLIIHNKTMNYSFEIEINDFTNCWYFNINDEKCEYSVELGRRPKDYNNSQVPNNYLYITSSNKIESPNGHVLFEKEQNVVFYKDVKTNETFSKDITKIDFIKYLGKAYKMQEIYKKIYKDENLLNLNNPSSH